MHVTSSRPEADEAGYATEDKYKKDTFPLLHRVVLYSTLVTFTVLLFFLSDVFFSKSEEGAADLHAEAAKGINKIFDVTPEDDPQLRSELKKIREAHSNMVKTYEGKLSEFGIPVEELGFDPLVPANI